MEPGPLEIIGNHPMLSQILSSLEAKGAKEQLVVYHCCFCGCPVWLT